MISIKNGTEEIKKDFEKCKSIKEIEETFSKYDKVLKSSMLSAIDKICNKK